MRTLIVCLFVILLVSASAFADASLRAEYLFSDGTGSTTAADTSGFAPAMNGVLFGNARITSDAAATFDGLYTSYVNCGNDAKVIDQNQVTVMAWIKIGSSDPGWHHIIGKGNTYRLDWTGPTSLGGEGLVFIANRPDAPWPDLNVTCDVSTNVWHHVAAVYDSYDTNSLKIYVDGELGAMKAPTIRGPIYADADPLLIGGNPDSAYGETGFTGKIDSARVLSGAITQTEIQTYMDLDVPLPLPSPRAEYLFSDGAGSTTAADTSGFPPAMNGVLFGNAQITSDAAATFDGLHTSYINCGNDAKVIDPNQVTVMAWINIGSSDPGWHHIIGKGNTYRLDWNGEELVFVANRPDAPWDDLHIACGDVSTNVWHHVAAVYDRYDTNSLKIYVDGELGAMKAPTIRGPIYANADPLLIGGNPDTSYGETGFAGEIDSARVFSGALTQTEIQVYMELDTPLPAQSLRAEYLFSDGTGSTTAADTSGFPPDMNGTLFGNAQITCNAAATFDGSNTSYVDCGNNTKVANQSQVTVMAWIKIGSSEEQYQHIIGKGNTYRLDWHGDGGILVFVANRPVAPWDDLHIACGVSTNEWHHVAAVYNRYDLDSLKMYVDGELGAMKAPTIRGPIWLEPAPLLIGGNPDTSYGETGFDGEIDSARVFSGALTQTEIQTYMDLDMPHLSNFKAGSNAWLQLPANSVQLNGSAAHNGVGTLTYTWSKDSNSLPGAGTVTFSPSANVLNPIATFSSAGTYVLKLHVSDECEDASSFLSVKVYPSTADPLVAHYTFDNGDAADSSGYTPALDGTFSGGAAVVDDPVRGKVLYLDGTPGLFGSFVDCGIDARLVTAVPDVSPPITNSMTLAAWVKVADTEIQEWQMAIYKQGSFQFAQVGDLLGVVVAEGVAKDDFDHIHAYAGDVGDGNWHHMAGVYDGSELTLKMYIDGVLGSTINTASGGYIHYSETTNLYLGIDEETLERTFYGYLDDVRIYDQALTEAQIAALVPAGDLNADNKVDFKDFGVMGEHWLEDGTTACAESQGSGYVYLPGDIDRDCKVGLSDVAIFAQKWLSVSTDI